jgi:hypothetical protein
MLVKQRKFNLTHQQSYCKYMARKNDKRKGIRSLIIYVNQKSQPINESPPPPPKQQQPEIGLDFLAIKAPRSHTDTPHSVGQLWTSDQPDAEISTWQ